MFSLLDAKKDKNKIPVRLMWWLPLSFEFGIVVTLLAMKTEFVYLLIIINKYASLFENYE